MVTSRQTLQCKAGLIAALILLAPSGVAAGAQEPPRLVLQITVNALRGDLPKRYAHLFGDSDDREYETDFPGFGRTFPLPYGAADDEYLTTRLTLSPAGDELTLAFAKALIDAEQLGQDAVPDYLAVSFSSTDSVGHLFGTASLPDTELLRAILKNFHPKRSGDIYVVFEPNVFITDFDGLTVASTHGSPWRYDTFVPVIFAGAGLEPKTVSRPVTPYDVAPTLANYLGIKPPSGAIGNPLTEVVGN